MITLDMAKMAFNPKVFDAPVDKAKRKILSEFGAYVRTIAKNSIKTMPKEVHAKPGQAPYGHDGSTRYKDWIFFFVDHAASEVVIGAVALPRKDQTLIPNVLENGGQTQIPKRSSGGKVIGYTTVMQQSRPHMSQAFEKAKKEKLPKLIEGSIVKG